MSGWRFVTTPRLCPSGNPHVQPGWYYAQRMVGRGRVSEDAAVATD
ncbi:hypothetical protein [Candidatus Aalborgicola defluviihabitans]